MIVKTTLRVRFPYAVSISYITINQDQRDPHWFVCALNLFISNASFYAIFDVQFTRTCVLLHLRFIYVYIYVVVILNETTE